MNKSANDSMNARWLRWSLSAIAVLLAIIAIELSALTGPTLPEANAQVPDAGLQRVNLLAEQRATTAKLQQILNHLQTQSIKVEVAGTDRGTRKKPAPASRAAPQEK